MAPLSNSRWQNHKERPNESTYNGDMVHKVKRDVMSEWVKEMREWVVFRVGMYRESEWVSAERVRENITFIYFYRKAEFLKNTQKLSLKITFSLWSI